MSSYLLRAKASLRRELLLTGRQLTVSTAGVVPPKKSYRAIVISGPSGSGKSTLVKRLMEEHENCFAFCVSHTTRKPREGEIDGQDYHFVTLTDMNAAIKRNEFLEYTKFSGQLYGTSKQSLETALEKETMCIMDVEKMGVQALKRTKVKALYIFIRPPSLQILKERLRRRATDADDAMQKRLLHAKAAIQYAEIPGSYDHIIINDDLDKAYEELKAILAPIIQEMTKSKKSV